MLFADDDSGVVDHEVDLPDLAADAGRERVARLGDQSRRA